MTYTSNFPRFFTLVSPDFYQFLSQKTAAKECFVHENISINHSHQPQKKMHFSCHKIDFYRFWVGKNLNNTPWTNDKVQLTTYNYLPFFAEFSMWLMSQATYASYQECNLKYDNNLLSLIANEGVKKFQNKT